MISESISLPAAPVTPVDLPRTPVGTDAGSAEGEDFRSALAQQMAVPSKAVPAEAESKAVAGATATPTAKSAAPETGDPVTREGEAPPEALADVVAALMAGYWSPPVVADAPAGAVAGESGTVSTQTGQVSSAKLSKLTSTLVRSASAPVATSKGPDVSAATTVSAPANSEAQAAPAVSAADFEELRIAAAAADNPDQPFPMADVSVGSKSAVRADSLANVKSAEVLAKPGSAERTAAPIAAAAAKPAAQGQGQVSAREKPATGEGEAAEIPKASPVLSGAAEIQAPSKQAPVSTAGNTHGTAAVKDAKNPASAAARSADKPVAESSPSERLAAAKFQTKVRTETQPDAPPLTVSPAAAGAKPAAPERQAMINPPDAPKIQASLTDSAAASQAPATTAGLERTADDSARVSFTVGAQQPVSPKPQPPTQISPAEVEDAEPAATVQPDRGAKPAVPANLAANPAGETRPPEQSAAEFSAAFAETARRSVGRPTETKRSPSPSSSSTPMVEAAARTLEPAGTAKGSETKAHPDSSAASAAMTAVSESSKTVRGEESRVGEGKPANTASAAAATAAEIPQPSAAQTFRLDPQAPAAASAAAPEARGEISTPVSDPAWREELGQKLAAFADRNIGTAELKLNPGHLGPLEVTIRLHEDGASLQFASAHAPVREAIESAVPRLREMLGAHQINVADVSVGMMPQGSFSAPDQSSSGFQQQARPGASGMPAGNLATNEERAPEGQLPASNPAGSLSLYA